MGLDMYLRAERYASAYENFSSDEDKRVIEGIAALTGMRPCADSPSITIRVTVGYWRKANAIHRWFVEHCGGGVDDCRPYYVGYEQLAELYEEARAVLSNPKEGEVRLPTQGGFFFGSTDCDAYYLQDMRDTVEILEKIFKDPAMKGCDFYYEASW